MSTGTAADVTLTPLEGEPRTVAQLVTTFHLAVVVLDPFTYESAWLIDEAGRILQSYTAADVRVGWVVTGTVDQAREFLGPWGNELLAFADPDREFVKATGLTELPALVHVDAQGAVAASAQGWDPDAWRRVTTELSHVLSWSKPSIPGPGAPRAYPGTPAVP